MRKEIFESEEEMMEFLKECVPDDRCLTDDEIVLKAKSLNLIKKSIVEEAEDAYNEVKHYTFSQQFRDVLEKQHEAIQYLKERRK